MSKDVVAFCMQISVEADDGLLNYGERQSDRATRIFLKKGTTYEQKGLSKK